MSIALRRILSLHSILFIFICGLTPAAASYLENTQVREYIKQIASEHAFGEAELRGLFDKISPQKSVLEKNLQTSRKAADLEVVSTHIPKKRPHRKGPGVLCVKMHNY